VTLAEGSDKMRDQDNARKKKGKGIRTRPSVRLALHDLVAYVNTQSQISDAVLVGVSGNTCWNLILSLLERKAKVTLYIPSVSVFARDNSGAARGSEYQVERIGARPDEIVKAFRVKTMPQTGTLIVKQHRLPPSLLAVKIEDDHLLMSWYVSLYYDKDQRSAKFGGFLGGDYCGRQWFR